MHSLFQLNWGLVWPVQAGRPELRWRWSGGVAKWQISRGNLARPVSQGRSNSCFPFLSAFHHIHLSLDSSTVPRLQSDYLFVFPTHESLTHCPPGICRIGRGSFWHWEVLAPGLQLGSAHPGCQPLNWRPPLRLPSWLACSPLTAGPQPPHLGAVPANPITHSSIGINRDFVLRGYTLANLFLHPWPKSVFFTSISRYFFDDRDALSASHHRRHFMILRWLAICPADARTSRRHSVTAAIPSRFRIFNLGYYCMMIHRTCEACDNAPWWGV